MAGFVMDENPIGDKLMLLFVIVVSIAAAAASLISLAVFLNWVVSQ